MYFKVLEESVDSLKKSMKKLNYPVLEDIRLDEPPNPKMGDLASSISFQLAKELKKSPMDITNNLMDNIEKPNLIEKIEAKGPYINFFIDYKKFTKELLEEIDSNYGTLQAKDEKIVLEHTSANPNGSLHIGHARNAIIGDSLKRILKSAGYDVETQYYVNDMGRQIAMVVWGFLNLDMPKEEEKKDHQIGKLYFEVNKKLKKDESVKDGVDALIEEYEGGENEELNKLFEKSINSCISGVNETLNRLNIHHDEFVWEGKFLRNCEVDEIVDELIKTGYTEMREVLCLNLEDFGIEKELVLRRSDGTSLYSTRDLAYHREKAEKGDIVLDILGSDHKLAIDQISIALKLLKSTPPEVIFYEFITLPEGSMSTRQGIFVSVDDLIDEAIKRAKIEVNDRRTDLSEAELEEISEIVGIGAIRYYIAKLSPEKHMVFKWDEALSFERGCASIQYAHARASKIIKKSGKDMDSIKIDENWVLTEDEIDLVRTIAKLPKIIKESAEMRRIHNLTQYSQDLANSFNKFYKSSQVIGSEYENSRLLLVEKSRLAIANSLSLLGITAPEVM